MTTASRLVKDKRVPDFDEFQAMVPRHFRAIEFFGQRVVNGSLIARFKPQQPGYEIISLNGERIWHAGSTGEWWQYFLIIASNASLPELPASLLGFGASEYYRNGLISKLSQAITQMQVQPRKQEADRRQLLGKAAVPACNAASDHAPFEKEIGGRK